MRDLSRCLGQGSLATVSSVLHPTGEMPSWWRVATNGHVLVASRDGCGGALKDERGVSAILRDCLSRPLSLSVDVRLLRAWAGRATADEWGRDWQWCGPVVLDRVLVQKATAPFSDVGVVGCDFVFGGGYGGVLLARGPDALIFILPVAVTAAGGEPFAPLNTVEHRRMRDAWKRDALVPPHGVDTVAWTRLVTGNLERAERRGPDDVKRLRETVERSGCDAFEPPRRLSRIVTPWDPDAD